MEQSSVLEWHNTHLVQLFILSEFHIIFFVASLGRLRTQNLKLFKLLKV